MSNKEILIIDDDRMFRAVIKRTLRYKDYTFFEAESVREAISQIDEHPHIQVIVLDLSLPDGTGGDFLEHIRTRASRYRVIVITAHDESLAAERAGEYGVFTYLPKAERAFTQSMVFSVTQAFADIEREQLLEKIKALSEIQNRINSEIREGATVEENLETLKRTLSFICQSANRLLGSYTCHIRLYNLATGDFELAAFAGPSDDVGDIFQFPKRRGEPVSGIVAESKRPFLLTDLQSDREFLSFKEHLLGDKSVADGLRKYVDTVRSVYIAPITTQMFHDDVDAVLNISSESADFFSEEKKEVVNELVAHVAIAITKVWQKKIREEIHRDYKETSRVLEDLRRAFEDITNELRAEDIKEKIYDITLKGISEIIGPETISILLYDKTAGLLESGAEFAGDRRVKMREEGIPIDGGLTGLVFTAGKPLRIPNLQDGDRRRPKEHDKFDGSLETAYLEFVPGGSVEHYLGAPMIIGDDVIGVIQLLNKKSTYYGKTADRAYWLLERGFSDENENVLGIAASYLAVAIKNLDLLEERSKKTSQLETLKDVGRFTSSEMPLDDLLKTIIEEAAEDLQAEICLLFLLDESRTNLVLEQCYGIPKESIEGASYEIGEGLAGMVARTGQSVIKTSDAHVGKYDEAVASYLRQKHGGVRWIESLMIVPIRAKNELLGAIKAINKKGGGGHFNHEDLSFFEAFANYVGIAIENAQRYNLINERLAIAERNSTLSHIVRAVVHEINNTKALIPMNVELIKDYISRSNYDIKEMLDVIEDSAKRDVAFANSIQAFSAGRLGRRKIHDINRLIQKAIEELAPELEINEQYKAVQLRQYLSAEVLECSVYETPFIQVIQNIILNAYQAMERSTRKILTVTSGKDVEHNLVRIEVDDTGHGIESEILDRIFDPEFTTKAGTGTGMGLWLAKTHLDSINANIKVTSRPGEGVTFTIEIPIAETDESEKK